MFCTKSITFIAAALATSTALAAPVGTITYSDTVTPTVIYGTAGGLDGGFTVSRDATTGLELGLRARTRFTNDFMDQGTGNYGSFAASSGPLALWNFDFSVNSNYNGAGSNLSTNGYTYVLGIDFDPAVGNTITSFYNISTTCFDNQFGNNSTGTNQGTAVNCGTSGAYANALATNNVVQNSENLGFLTTFFSQSFDASAFGQYAFTLQAFNRAGTLVGETDITVAVPEPAPLALVSLGLVGLGLSSRRRKTRA